MKATKDNIYSTRGGGTLSLPSIISPTPPHPGFSDIATALYYKGRCLCVGTQMYKRYLVLQFWSYWLANAMASLWPSRGNKTIWLTFKQKIFFQKNTSCHYFRISVIPSVLLSFLPNIVISEGREKWPPELAIYASTYIKAGNVVRFSKSSLFTKFDCT